MKFSPWWKEATIYQIYPRSFFDSNGDGEGDLPGITANLEYVQQLGVDAIWLSPFYTSPNKDGGYDVADPRDVDPRFGNLGDAKKLIDCAHELGLRVLADIVPNHFSDQHIWFQAALKAGRGSAERARFHFYDPNPDGTPPNNWISLFGGPSWTQVEDGQYYLHLFDSSQPDLNWENPDVNEDFEKTLRFWIDLGVDGFRIDVAHGLVKEDVLKNHPDPQGLSNALRLDVDMDPEKRNSLLQSVPYFDRQGVHEIYRKWRLLFDSYGDREIMAVAEAWVHPPVNATRYVRPDELHQVFNFDLLTAEFDASVLYDVIDRSIKLNATVNALPTWALSNHDSPRVSSRIGSDQARALALFVFGLPGSTYIFAGQELGLPDGELADSDRQDPSFFRTNGEIKGRDGARVPLPWSGERAPFGFTSGKPWLPISQSWAQMTVESESKDPKSSLHLYRTALALRQTHLTGQGDISWRESLHHGSKSDSLLSYQRGPITVVMNLSNESQECDVVGRPIVVSSGTVDAHSGKKVIPARSCAWFIA
ncbi:MAG: alpha-amylase family glycosyl hydrolase [Actinomycetes bacterium]